MLVFGLSGYFRHTSALVGQLLALFSIQFCPGTGSWLYFLCSFFVCLFLLFCFFGQPSASHHPALSRSSKGQRFTSLLAGRGTVAPMKLAGQPHILASTTLSGRASCHVLSNTPLLQARLLLVTCRDDRLISPWGGCLQSGPSSGTPFPYSHFFLRVSLGPSSRATLSVIFFIQQFQAILFFPILTHTLHL